MILEAVKHNLQKLYCTRVTTRRKQVEVSHYSFSKMLSQWKSDPKSSSQLAYPSNLLLIKMVFIFSRPPEESETDVGKHHHRQNNTA